MNVYKNFKTILLTIGFAALTSCSSNMKNGFYAKINTNKGTMVMKLYYKETPITVANFVTLAKGTNPSVTDSLKEKPYYNGLIFHRVIKDFMIQGGDPTGTGMGSPGYKFKDEIVDSLKFDKKGVFAMANSGPMTNGSQFFITLKDTPHLNGRHTIFGQIVEGESVLDSIGNTLTSKEGNTIDKPINDIVINDVDIVKVGAEASAFDAVKVFSDYMEKKNKSKKELIVQFDSQKAKAKTLPSGVQIFVMKEGQGAKPKEGDDIKVNYAGYLSDGTLFDTNWSDIAKKFNRYNQARPYNPMPLKFSSKMSLVSGFKEALLSMAYGEKVRVFIPSSLAYGERGSGPIPPNSDLIFDIEILEQ